MASAPKQREERNPLKVSVRSKTHTLTMSTSPVLFARRVDRSQRYEEVPGGAVRLEGTTEDYPEKGTPYSHRSGQKNKALIDLEHAFILLPFRTLFFYVEA